MSPTARRDLRREKTHLILNIFDVSLDVREILTVRKLRMGNSTPYTKFIFKN